MTDLILTLWTFGLLAGWIPIAMVIERCFSGRSQRWGRLRRSHFS